MRYIALFVKIVLFLLLFAFAIKNTDPVVLHGFVDSRWQAPLILVLLAFFVAGAVLGVSAMLLIVFRMRRELADTQKQLRVYTERPKPKQVDEVEPAVPLDAVV